MRTTGDCAAVLGGEGVTQESRGYRFPDAAELNDEFHVYGFEWTSTGSSTTTSPETRCGNADVRFGT